MATRGTAVIIGDESVNMGPEFNGDMYPHGFGNEFMKLLSNVETDIEFIIFNNRFNKYNFEYREIMKSYQGKYSNEELMDNGIYTMRKIYDNVTSDWVFVKNITSKSVKIQVLDDYKNVDTDEQKTRNISVRPGEVIRVYFGILKDGGKGHRMKASK